MARRQTTNRAKSLKRPKKQPTAPKASTTKGSQSRLAALLGRARSAITSLADRIRKSLKRETKAERLAREKEEKQVLRYYEIRSNLTILRGPKQVESSWVDSIAYIRYGRKNGVAVKFLSGFEAFYPNTTIRDYEYLRDAKSKGKAIHRRFYELPYEQINQ